MLFNENMLEMHAESRVARGGVGDAMENFIIVPLLASRVRRHSFSGEQPESYQRIGIDSSESSFALGEMRLWATRSADKTQFYAFMNN